ncbi:hypothetical protein B0H12DRAFT_116902 [Mycena haematopus]|nr:hypothetical protein B0H12DRAFT_116902 [Mycena haematopus]
MYFHNVATHCHPRVPSVAKSCWAPYSIVGFCPSIPVRTRERERNRLELQFGSEALPRPSRPLGPVHFQPPSGGDGATTYVLSWPPTLATPAVSPGPASSSLSDSSFGDGATTYVLSWPPTLSTPAVSPHSPASSSSSNSSFASLYYTPPTSGAFAYTPTSMPSTPDLTDDSALGSPQESQIDEVSRLPMTDVLTESIRGPVAKPKGWARLRANAPPALQLNTVKSKTTSAGMN